MRMIFFITYINRLDIHSSIFIFKTKLRGKRSTIKSHSKIHFKTNQIEIDFDPILDPNSDPNKRLGGFLKMYPYKLYNKTYQCHTYLLLFTICFHFRITSNIITYDQDCDPQVDC